MDNKYGDIPEKNLTKIVTSPVKTKRNVKNSISNVFMAEDVDNVKNYIVQDVILPAVKNLFADAIHGTTDMVLYGRVNKGKSRYPDGSRVSYSSYSKQDSQPAPRINRLTRMVEDVVIQSRPEANEVLDTMRELIDIYHKASVADLNDLVGRTGNGYTDRKIGWTNLNDAYIRSVRDGYIIEFPKLEDLE